MLIATVTFGARLPVTAMGIALLPELDAAAGANGPSPRLWRRVRSQDAAVARRIVSEEIASHSLRLANPRARFLFTYSTTRLSALTLSDFAYQGTASEVILPQDDRDCYLLIIPVSGYTVALHDDVRNRLKPGNAMVFNPIGSLAFENSPDWRNLDIRIGRSGLERYIRRATGERPVRPVRFENRPFDLLKEGRPLLRFLKYLLLETQASDANLLFRQTAERLEEALYALLLDTVPNELRATERATGTRSVPKIVEAAERFMVLHACEPIDVDTIAAGVRVRPRTLHKAFKRYREHSPLEFLRNHRLDLARARLEKSSPGETTVTAIALACGFNHVARFAASYRERFGENPSDTLRFGSARR